MNRRNLLLSATNSMPRSPSHRGFRLVVERKRWPDVAHLVFRAAFNVLL